VQKLKTPPTPTVGSQVDHWVGRAARSLTWAELVRPSDGSMVEFWCRGMAQQGTEGAGIRGWFRQGLFWSRDDADHYSPGEVTNWISIRTRMQCAARGCDGCLVCAPNVRAKRGQTAQGEA
jgi:hypothetical protein